MAKRTKTIQVCLVVIPMVLAVCCTGMKVYKKLGDDTVLKPNTDLKGPIKSILWKHGIDIAIEWDAEGVVAYRQFQNRTKLNNVNGELTIMGLTQNDSGIYTAEINSVPYTPTHLAVILSVPEPKVVTSCNTEETICTLTCAGNTTGAEPVTYTWMFGHAEETNSSMERIMQKETLSADEIKCELQNPVSTKRSPSANNPFLTVSTEGAGNLKVNTGLTVFTCLLTAIILVVLIHKCKTGKWFFQKASMPWEADFWRKQERQHESRGTHESNGTTAYQEKTLAEEERPMT
ncbi:carcinoembryonic antigen-related cell adhesion molecule 21-like isoform X2 [Corythoichthys intestinalis]|uniref:carcinoembryonic antigen-related cell adhesion molecule 21-like isoform X2 n=1 Tax=Corythoichthys intestinalis TaxID=161448 RepID=UPI0025A64B41|nr:carcinoembryonic antigen-related cell adhesion molecule 21-like isoform X2 [Corythoichthys intestinalis]XP_057685369.1 carcinoembryonic antigen-related cell adhesion molecule 21-like isoform X2 [Corythoichthys intestinalis]